jgi:predicted regulator of Ras-like GTPase activity (Roadblock/LC7/MglB family)
MLAGLSAEQGRSLNAAVSDLMAEAEASAVFLTDNTGNVLAERSSLDPRAVQTIAALSAGAFCATRELAVQIGEETFQSISHRGATCGMYIQSVGGQFLLLVIYGRNTTEGLVKLYVKRLCDYLDPILRDVAGQSLAAAAPAGQRFEMQSTRPLFPGTA